MPMRVFTLTLTNMAADGRAIGRDRSGRVVFVPQGIPGERVRVRLLHEGARFAHAELLSVEEASPDRVTPPCNHFGRCGGCDWQHIDYAAQLNLKAALLRDQLQRVGKLKRVDHAPVTPHPAPYHSRTDFTFFPVEPATDAAADDAGDAPEPTRLGLWSPVARRVIPIDTCEQLAPPLQALFDDIDFDLPTLRDLTLRLGDDDARLIALTAHDIEPPSLQSDFAVSVALVRPDGQAATLIGDGYVIRRVPDPERYFRVSAGCEFQTSVAGASLLKDTVLELARLTGREHVIDAYSGVGMLTAYLAAGAATVHGIEINTAAIDDAVINLDDTDNVALYNDWVEDALPIVAPDGADLLVVDPPGDGLSEEALAAIDARAVPRLVYSSSDVQSLAQNARVLTASGYRLTALRPLDLYPQTARLHTVSLWQR